MDPWSEVQIHEEHNLTLLCALHHDEVTRGLLPASAVARADQNPLNIVNGKSAKYLLHYEGESAVVHLGSSQFTAAPRRDIDVVRIFGRPLLWFIYESGDYELNLEILREGGDRAVRIAANELVYTTDAWDVTFTGRNLTIRDGFRNVYLEVEFRTPSTVVVKRGVFWHERHFVKIVDQRVEYGSMRMPGGASRLIRGTAENISVGIDIYDERVPRRQEPGLVGFRSYPPQPGESFPWSTDASMPRYLVPPKPPTPRPVMLQFRYGERKPR